MHRILPIAAAAALVAATAAIYAVGSALSAPVLRPVGPPPADLAAVSVDHDGLKGWFVPAAAGAPCVALMHGIRGDRRGMIARARMLREAGYASLLFDFQAHGESPGRRITFGHLEAANARTAVALLRRDFQCKRVAAIGQSLGGAAALLGEAALDVDALVLESVYPTIEDAVASRLRARLGELGALLTPLLTLQLGLRLDIDAGRLRPIERIASFRRPVLIIAGTEDRHTPLAQARRLFEAANEPKAFWAVDGAAHVDIHRFDPDGYRRRVLGFLENHLTPN